MKYGVTSGLTWDFTVNTDFSQVEADEQQVNLSRFSLFFPEKRDFFLENSGIFQFGGGGGGGAAGAAAAAGRTHRRTCGCSSAGGSGCRRTGTEIPILGGDAPDRAGGRVFGGRAQHPAARADGARRPSTNFTAVRVRRDILANSDVGVMLLNKERERLALQPGRRRGCELPLRVPERGRIRRGTMSPRGRYPAAARSSRPGASATTRRGRGSSAARYNGIGERFNDEMGFVPRVGVNNGPDVVGRAFRPAWLSRSASARSGRTGRWRCSPAGTEAASSRDTRTGTCRSTSTTARSSKSASTPTSRRSASRSPSTARRGVRVNPGRYEFNEWFVLWNTNSAAPFSFNSRYSIGDFYDGYRRGYTLGPTVRVNEHFNASLGVQVNDIELSNGSFVTTLVTWRVNYNFNTRMFLNALIQYNTDSRQLSSNLRFNVIHRPLSDIFLVYNERRDERTGDRIDRALIAKMTYMMAF